MLGGVQMVAVREMRMVSRLLMVLLLMMLRGVAVMLRRLLVVLRRLFVMLGHLGCVHFASPSSKAGQRPAAGVDIGSVTLS
jgi:hypothetical protein